jgi:myo-inositol-1-phosphate synthase
VLYIDIDLPTSEESDDTEVLQVPETDVCMEDSPGIQSSSDRSIDDNNSLIKSAAYLYENLLSGQCAINEGCQSHLLQQVHDKLTKEKIIIKESRTGRLWLQYCEI